MALEKNSGRENALWKADKRTENTKHIIYSGEESLIAGELESISSSYGNFLIEMRRKANLEREDGLVGDNYLMISDLGIYAVFDGVGLSSGDSASSFGVSKLLEKNGNNILVKK